MHKYSYQCLPVCSMKSEKVLICIYYCKKHEHKYSYQCLPVCSMNLEKVLTFITARNMSTNININVHLLLQDIWAQIFSMFTCTLHELGKVLTFIKARHMSTNIRMFTYA